MAHIVVAVESQDVAAVEAAVGQVLSLESAGVGGGGPLGLRVEVADAASSIAYANRFLEAEGIEDDNALWRDLDAKKFAVEVEVSADAGLGRALLEAIGDHLAREISVALGCRTTLSVADGYVAFGLYQSGGLSKSYPGDCRAHFEGHAWRPAFLGPGDGDAGGGA